MDDFERNKRIVSERKKLNTYRRKLYAQKRLEYNITKKIKTTMIGALASFEEAFGYLWGMDIDFDNLNEQQLAFLDTWEETRREILNKGNMQIRAAQDEISEYDTEWNRYTTEFITQRNRNDD